ncbi:uracil-DNA glycosylase family protein [Thiococcus pfennigii]|jgi:single-strand selective monofunctional uracil DNA glycosylase|uniref:uracil-DNA glycosylase family protein n=1 Tax=Thiococcus pfennigii TaxID=1057 RepID=UPI00190851EA|nr:uracil-DNA glycosylase family protein [Thiococcus pfennigii]MBK1699635.1 single-stranded DNA-binding protein [Thiococcus pfennigii]MBK1732735.1 single-stranded DNA-binding protein [Thiococcus pfennigii]
MNLIDIAGRLRDEVDVLSFAAPVAYVYNPLDYAWPAQEAYLRRFGGGRPQVVLLGMNPGPFGMAQTGVPFGDVGMVREWLGIEAAVGRPQREHPKRPVTGFACPRREVSGQRLWGWAQARFPTPERFFAQFFVANYCPLAFLEEGGRNRTPDALPKVEREPLFAACDRALRATVEALAPAYVVGIGQFAADRAAAALGGLEVTVGRILHPSPASPAANRGWARQAEEGLRELGVSLPDRAGTA